MTNTISWQIDPAHSSVEFAVKHMMFTTVRGRFKDVKGTIEVDEQNPDRSTVNVEIGAASIDTGAADRDRTFLPVSGEHEDRLRLRKRGGPCGQLLDPVRIIEQRRRAVRYENRWQSLVRHDQASTIASTGASTGAAFTACTSISIRTSLATRIPPVSSA